MASNNSLNCTHGSRDIKANPDIIGPGVFAAFLATAAFTVLAVIFGYLSNSIDDELLNYADRRLICFIQEAWHGVYRSAGRYMPIIASTPARPTLESVEATKARQEVLTHLAWFSSTTHLATLDVLRETLKLQGFIRNLRVAAMIAVIILLAYVFVVDFVMLVGIFPINIPVQCVFHAKSLPDGFTPLGMQWVVVIACILLYTGGCYIVRIQDLYVHQRRPEYVISWLLWKIRRHQDDASSHREAFAHRRALSRLQDLKDIQETSGLWRKYLESVHGYEGSFLASSIGIVFSISYGAGQVFYFREYAEIDRFGLDVNATTLDFGQLVPLLLLLLPCLAAGETYVDHRNKQRQQAKEPLPAQTSERNETIALATLHNEVFNGHDDKEYEQYVKRIEKYFPQEVHTLVRDASTLPMEDISGRKGELLRRYQEIKGYENDVDVIPTLVRFVWNVSFAVATAVLVNGKNWKKHATRIKVGMALLFGYTGGAVVGLAIEAVGLLRLKEEP